MTDPQQGPRPRARDKQTDALVRAAWDAGWRVEQGRKHIRVYPPDPTQAIVTIAGTPSDHRTVKNTRAQLRRSGLDC